MESATVYSKYEMEYIDCRIVITYDALMLSVDREVQYKEIFKLMCNF